MVTRVVRGTQADIGVAYTDEDGVTAPEQVQVSIITAAGVVLVDNAVASSVVDGEATFTLPPLAVAELDTLTAAWTSTVDGRVSLTVTRIEVVGGYLFSIAEARQEPDLAADRFSTAAIVAARTLAEEIIERGAGIAFVPRYARKAVAFDSRGELIIPDRALRRVRSIIRDDGDAIATGGYLTRGNVVTPLRRWRTTGLATIAYEHGLDAPTERISSAALLLARVRLTKGPIDDRATSLATADGSIRLLTPGVAGSITGIPEVDAAIMNEGYAQAGMQ